MNIEQNLLDFNECADLEDDGILSEPFNPNDIVILKKVVSIDQIIRRINNGTILLSPSFQRNKVWNNKKKSRLIESLMVNIPIPLFYVAETDNGSWEVVDGLQRLSTIKEFFIDKSLVLNDLEYYNNYNGKSINSDNFSSLIYNRLYETEFSFVIIGKGTPEAVKYNIFNRLNTSGEPLSKQEIRHALNQGASTKLLYDLSLSPDFLTATCNSIDDKRMKAREFILRCLTFMLIGKKGYKKTDNMDSFLLRGMKLLNILENNTLLNDFQQRENIEKIYINNYTDLIKNFNNSMKRNFELFGENSFRFSKTNDKRSPINKALFDSWGTILSNISEEQFTLLKNNVELLMSKYDDLKQNLDFYDAASRTAYTQQNVLKRFYYIENLIKDVISHDK